ncbi:MAG TPA: NRDE family protein [Chitinophagaceae bacterium]|nr:NRDE family protein [Chitinophagaceae bacterium]
MCTVTYIPVNNKYFISSNRDEKSNRGQAIPPGVYRQNDKMLIFPKDPDAGGSWIALHENGNAAVLLNGAFEKHDPLPPFRKSRGLIFLNIISQEKPVRYFQQTDLLQIEPFTLVIAENNNLYECRWDGNEKYYQQLKKHRPYIWSSVTLYDKEVVNKREQWFAAFLNSNPHPTQKDILEFHQFTGDGDSSNDLMMERKGLFSTVSITSMLLTAERGSMKYLDLKNNSMHEKKIEFISAYTAG